ncbi:MAG: hypothetical protein HY308_11295 [Gammaproteobacteria bacterium]|nr:hypothetical protein [Gammaproteobacteria bacterium]
MLTRWRRLFFWVAVFVPVIVFAATTTGSAERARQQVVDGVAIYFGIVPAELVRGHPPQHAESDMHGGVPVGESHIMVALFDNKTGKRIDNVEANARVTGSGLHVEKKLEPMVVAGSLTYGNYFSLTGSGPYRIAIRFRLPGAAHESHAEFAWARS